MSIDDIPITTARALMLIDQGVNVSKAAKLLGVSQPAISKGITQLEKQLKVPIIRRGSRPVELTAEGKRIAEYAVITDQLRSNTLQNIEELRLHKKGIVRVGSIGASASTHVLPDRIDSFTKRYPNIEIQILEAPDQETLQALQTGLIDIAVMTDILDDEIETLPITTDELVALVPVNDPLSDNAKLSAAEIENKAFIMTTGGSAPFVMEWFQEAKVTPSIKHSILQITSILALVKANRGVSIVAELALPPKLDGVKSIALTPAKQRDLIFARNRNTAASHAAETFWKYCEEIYFA